MKILKDVITPRYAIDVLFEDYPNWTLVNENWISEQYVIYTIRNKDKTIETEIKGFVTQSLTIVTEILLEG